MYRLKYLLEELHRRRESFVSMPHFFAPRYDFIHLEKCNMRVLMYTKQLESVRLIDNSLEHSI